MPRLPIRFMPEEFSSYVYKLLFEGPLRQVERGRRELRKLYFVASQGGGKSWSMASTAEWLMDLWEEAGYSVEVKMLDVDEHLREEYAVESIAELMQSMLETDADVWIGIIGEAASELSNMIISGEEYKRNILFARSFFQARHFSRAKMVYLMFASQKTKRMMGDVRDLADVIIIKALPRWEANLIVESLGITDRAVIEELMQLYDKAFIEGDKSGGIGVANDKAGLVRFDTPTRIIDPNYVSPRAKKRAEEILAQLREVLGIQDGGAQLRRLELQPKRIVDTVDRRCVSEKSCSLKIPRDWLKLIPKSERNAWEFVMQLVELDDSPAIVLKPRGKQHGKRGLLSRLFAR